MEYLKGIDISRWNIVNKYGAAAENIDFVIIKATQGRALSTTDYLFKDAKFYDHLNNFNETGVECGTYHYLTAQNINEARNEAEYYCATIAPYKNKIKLWVGVDVEEKKYLPLNNKSLLTSIVKEFCQVVENNGFRPIVYTNPDFLTNHMNNILQYDLWLAVWRNIDNIPSFATYPNMKVWQYSANGVVSGISGLVDMNLGFYNAADGGDREEDTMNYEKWKEYMLKYEGEQAKMAADNWAVDSQNWCKTNGISDGTFPKSKVTRQELWTMLKRFYDKFLK